MVSVNQTWSKVFRYQAIDQYLDFHSTFCIEQFMLVFHNKVLENAIISELKNNCSL